MKKRIKVSKGTRLFTITTYTLACFYNLGWVSLFILNPDFFQAYFPFSINTYPIIFGSLKVIVCTLGILYFFAALQPAKFWPLAVFSIIAKSFGAILAIILIESGWIYLSFYWQVFFNDLLWLPALGFIAYRYFKAWQDTTTSESPAFPAILQNYQTQYGISLAALQNTKPVMLIFLRHFGCTFCKEALGDLAQQRASIENEHELTMVFVHMADENYASKYFANYGLEDTHRISDPTCALYQAFSLKRASFQQVFGIKSWLRGLYAFVGKGHGIGKLVGDGFRMPGVFLIHQKQIHQSFRHQTASDIPPYQELASCPVI